MMTESNNWCSEPFNNIYVENIDGGKVAPCCASKTEKINQYFSLSQQPHLIKIRNQFLNGERPDACEYCWKNEEQGLGSRRLDSGQRSPQYTINSLEINVNNICNLKCRICGPYYSSGWHSDSKKLKRPVPKPGKNKLWQDINLSAITWIHFNGGEPLLTNDHMEILQKIPAKTNCTVYYNTNGTIKVDKAVLELWQQFKLIKLIFSIDDIEEHFEYQRSGARWAEVEANMFWYKQNAPHNTMFGINRTISRYNHHRLDYLNSWYKQNFPTNRYGDKNDFTEQLATGYAALTQSEEDFTAYDKNLNLIRITNVD